MSCNCCNGVPNLPGVPIECEQELVTGKTGYGVASRNDNACRIILDQPGLTFTGTNGITKNTDGSGKKGYILLNPDRAGGVESFLGLAQGKLMGIWYASDLPENTILAVKGNQWVPTSLEGRMKLFDPTKMKTGEGKLLALTCSSGGFAELAYFPSQPNTVIYMDADGKAQSLTLAEFTEELLIPFCENLPDLGTEEATATVCCSVNGLAKSVNGTTKSYFHEPMVTLYSQVKYQGIPGDDLNPGEVAYYPPLTPALPGAFLDQDLDIDLKTMPGYKDTATSLILSAQAGVGITGAAGVEKWHLVLAIQGRERIRVTAGEGDGSWNNTQNQFIIPMPTDKKLRISAQRQVAVAGTLSEISYAAVYLEAFLFN